MPQRTSSMIRFAAILILAGSLGAAASLEAQDTTLSFDTELRVSVEDIDCLPIGNGKATGNNGLAWARVENNVPDSQVRLYFRRLNDTVEDLYYVEMVPAGGGRYWGVFPKAEDQALLRRNLAEQRQALQDEYPWASWWKAKEASDDRNPTGELDQEQIRQRASQGKLEARHWMLEMDDAEFENWLSGLENEPAEYFASVHDAQGERLARSKTKVVPVERNCPVALTAQQEGVASNLTVGETAAWQQQESVFHWLCDGVVTRSGPAGILRQDDVCRKCVIAWWDREEVLIPAAAAIGIPVGIQLFDDRPSSPSAPF